MLGNIGYEIFVSARLIYLMLGHLSINASTFLFFTRSLAKLIAINVGETRWHTWMIASCDKLAPHSTRSVNLMHFVVRSAFVFARIGLYISPKSDACPFPTLRIRRRSGFLIMDKLTDVMRLIPVESVEDAAK